MQQFYHIDIAEPGLLETHSARWLRVRISGLLDIESRLRAALFPPKK